METILTTIQNLFKHTPEIAIFLSLGIGYAIGKINFGKFQLGGVAGSLLAAIIISLFGVTIDPILKNVLFALFIYTVGYTSGPQFFRSLGKKSIKEIILAAVLAITGLITVVVLAKLFGLDKGMAAGIASGGLTQSAIIGTASDALAKMGQLGVLTADQVHTMQANVGVGYAVTYIFGSLGTIIICVNVLPWVMKRGIREDAITAEANMHKSGRVVAGPEQILATPDLTGRLFKVTTGAGMTLTEVEAMNPDNKRLTVERLKRGNKSIGIEDHSIKLQQGDIVLLVGQRDLVMQAEETIGPEVNTTADMEFMIQTRRVAVTNPKVDGKTLMEIYNMADDQMRHGVYVLNVSREGEDLALSADTVIKRGDLVTLYGSKEDVQRVSSVVGYSIIPTDKTDFVYLGFGIVVGLLIGLIVVRIGGIPITLGSGGGALLSGLLFGWFRSRHMKIGELPSSAAQILKDIGLAGFVVVVGLDSGQLAIQTIIHQGLTIFVLGLIVTILPLIITLYIGKYVLKYDNAAILAGALAGSRSANPAFGEVLNKAGNSVPTISFAITYALANVFLTLLGPLVVALV